MMDADGAFRKVSSKFWFLSFVCSTRMARMVRVLNFEHAFKSSANRSVKFSVCGAGGVLDRRGLLGNLARNSVNSGAGRDFIVWRIAWKSGVAAREILANFVMATFSFFVGWCFGFGSEEVVFHGRWRRAACEMVSLKEAQLSCVGVVFAWTSAA
jgi:hypothetical protein